jgi:hypothetical protein
MQIIINETDLYAQQQIAVELPKPGTKHQQWCPTAIHYLVYWEITLTVSYLLNPS